MDGETHRFTRQLIPLMESLGSSLLFRAVFYSGGCPALNHRPYQLLVNMYYLKMTIIMWMLIFRFIMEFDEMNIIDVYK